MPPVRLFHAIFKLDMWTFHSIFLHHYWRHFLFQHILHLWQQYSSTFGQGHVFLPKTFSAFSVTTGTQCFAMPHHLCNGVSAGCEMKIWCTWSGLWGEYRTLSICILWWLQWYVHLCVASLCHGGKALLTFFLWDKLDKGLHSNFVVSSQSSLSDPCARRWQE